MSDCHLAKLLYVHPVWPLLTIVIDIVGPIHGMAGRLGSIGRLSGGARSVSLVSIILNIDKPGNMPPISTHATSTDGIS